MAKILVIDDVLDHFELLDDALGRQHALYYAPDAVQGLQAATTLQPALILLDIGLPRMDADTFLRRLRTRLHLAAVPVVAVTAHAMAGDRERCIAAGCDDYLPKPINVTQLEQVIQRWIGDYALAATYFAAPTAHNEEPGDNRAVPNELIAAAYDAPSLPTTLSRPLTPMSGDGHDR
jgi:two-component system, cell cycle response regulator DivK